MIVLTGGAGFIGSCILKKFNDEGVTDILVVDNLGSSDKWKNLIGKKFLDYVDKSAFLPKLMNWEFGDSIKYIIHMGACSATTEKNASYLLENNFGYSKDLAIYSASRNNGFIYASSGATYGNGDKGYSDEEFDLRPLNCYGFSKSLFDTWVIDKGLDNKFFGLKFFNVFGPNEYHKGDMSSMVFKAYNQIMKTGKVKLFKSYKPDYKDGEQKRDFIYVKQVAEAVWKIYSGKPHPGIYNLGTGKARSWNDLAKAMFSALGTEPNIEYVDMPEQLVNQYQYFTEADMNKFHKKLNIKLEFPSLEDSVKDYAQNYLNQNWQYI